MLFSPSNFLIAAGTMLATATAQRTMGFIGCSMAENVASGYVAAGGQRMWGPYGTGGAVVQSWTNPNSPSWQSFDRTADSNGGTPDTVWIQICIFGQAGATSQEVRQLVANTRQHAPGADIYITGQPLYNNGNVCFLAGQGGPELTDRLAQEAAADASLDVTYAGVFWLGNGEVSDGCHANQNGELSLGRQAIDIWG